MQKETGKVFVACALGAGIGSLVALELNQWLWWVGLIVGGLTGYLSYDWKQVIRAIPRAARVAAPILVEVVKRCGAIGRDVYHGLRAFFGKPRPVFWSHLLFGAVFFSVISQAERYGDFIFRKEQQLQPPPIEWQSILIVATMLPILITTLILLVIMVFACFSINAREVTREKWSTRLSADLIPVDCMFRIHSWREAGEYYFDAFWNPVRMIGIAIWAIVFFAVALLPVGLAKFCWQVFIRIHSEMRLLCMADAALGATVGYFIGSAIIGALAGGLIGVANYALITERWLKPRGYIPST